MPTAIRVLIVEDYPGDAELVVGELRLGGFDPDWIRVETERDYLAGLATHPSVILADYNLPQFDAVRALHLLKESGLDIPFLVVSGAIGEETAVAIMRQGAADYLLKDRLARLPTAVAAALEKGILREEYRRSEEALRQAERRYREIFENAMEGLLQYGPEGQLLAVNPTLAKMLGYSFPEEVIAEGQALLRGLHVDGERGAELARVLKEEGCAHGFECQIYRKDRTTIWVSMSCRTARDHGGKIVRYDLSMVEITERRASAEALQRYQEELRDLAARLISAQEAERKHIGRELHDGFSQELAALSMEIGLLRAKPPASQRVLQNRLGEINEGIAKLAKSLNRASRALHPSFLYDLGLHEALESECSAFAEQHAIPIRFASQKVPGRISDDIALCLYRITQESLWNVRKYAQARNVRVALLSEDKEIVLTIEDDGCGFNREAVRGKGGLGLISMEERVRLVSGKVVIVSSPGAGTRLEVRVPIP